MSLSGKEFVKLLKINDWKLNRISGSHYILGKGNKTVSVPVHGNKSLGIGLEKKLFKQTGVKKK